MSDNGSNNNNIFGAENINGEDKNFGTESEADGYIANDTDGTNKSCSSYDTPDNGLTQINNNMSESGSTPDSMSVTDVVSDAAETYRQPHEAGSRTGIEVMPVTPDKTENMPEEFDPTTNADFLSGLDDAIYGSMENEKITLDLSLSSDAIEGQRFMDENYEDQMMEEISRSLSGIDNLGNTGLQQEEKKAVEETVIQDKDRKFKRRIKAALISVVSVFALLVLVLAFLGGTDAGRKLLTDLFADAISDEVVYDDGSVDEKQEIVDETVDDNEYEEIVNSGDANIVDEEDVKLDTDYKETMKEEGVVNILLLGEEALENPGLRGRSDVIMIASLNTNTKEYILTSIMRDTYVAIPGEKDNKINAAYAAGGVELMYETIELNFDIELDGYMLVGFEDFEKIVDILGGIDITLSASEAKYLREENYISNPEYRDVNTGVNHMNGNQVLGYCRIRYVNKGSESNDYGRTSRHREVLNAIFEKYKSLDYISMLNVAYSLLPYITTDMTKQDISDYLKMMMDIGLTEIRQLRLPADGAFETGYVRKMSVIIPNLPKNIDILHETVYGAGE